MRIQFKAYSGDNIVHELPGIQLPCNEMKYEEEDEKDTRPASETMMTQDREDEYIHYIEIPDDWNSPWNPKKKQYGSSFLREFSHWAHRVKDMALFVSGDDDYFDYYPGNISALVGIGEQLKDPRIEKLVHEVLQYAYDVRYYDLEPETIIPDGEVEEFEKRRDTKLTKASEIFREAYWNWQVRQLHT